MHLRYALKPVCAKWRRKDYVVPTTRQRYALPHQAFPPLLVIRAAVHSRAALVHSSFQEFLSWIRMQNLEPHYV